MTEAQLVEAPRPYPGVKLAKIATASAHAVVTSSAMVQIGVWGATEQKTGLSTLCRQPLDRRDVNIERLGAVPYILSLVQLG